MSKLLQDFQGIAQDTGDDRVELYSKLDNSDLIKLIIATPPHLEHAEEFVKNGWCSFYGGDGHTQYKKEFLARIRDSGLLPPFYVFVKQLTHT